MHALDLAQIVLFHLYSYNNLIKVWKNLIKLNNKYKMVKKNQDKILSRDNKYHFKIIKIKLKQNQVLVYLLNILVF